LVPVASIQIVVSDPAHWWCCLSSPSGKPNSISESYGSLVGVFDSMGHAFVLFAGQYFNAKKQMASNKALSETIHYVFSQEGINATAASSSGSTAWHNVFEAHETGRNFLIFISKNMMYTIPKRCFHSTGQIEPFKTLLRAQLGAKAKWR
jgi:hypothetical protein